VRAYRGNEIFINDFNRLVKRKDFDQMEFYVGFEYSLRISSMYWVIFHLLQTKYENMVQHCIDWCFIWTHMCFSRTI